MQTLSSCTGVFNCELIDAGIYPLLLAPQVRQRTLGEVGWVTSLSLVQNI